MSVFGPLKVIWNGTTRYLRLALKEKKLTIWEVPLAMQTAWEAGHSPQNIQSGFRTTGQYPLLSSKKWLEDHPGATTMGEAMKPGAKPKMSAAANQIGEMIGFKPPAAIGENPRHPCVATEPSRAKGRIPTSGILPSPLRPGARRKLPRKRRGSRRSKLKRRRKLTEKRSSGQS